MRAARAQLMALVGLAAAIGCTSPAGPSEIEATLHENRSRFRALVGGSYVFDYRNLCFCPVFLVDGVRITVREHRIVSVAALTDGQPEPPERWHFYKTVEDVFSAIEDAVGEGKFLLLIDVARTRVDEIEEIVKNHYPELPQIFPRS